MKKDYLYQDFKYRISAKRVKTHHIQNQDNDLEEIITEITVELIIEHTPNKGYSWLKIDHLPVVDIPLKIDINQLGYLKHKIEIAQKIVAKLEEML